MNVLIFIGKGGGGKTVTTINLAVVAHRLGLSVGLLDADPQCSLSDWRHARGTADIPVRPCRPDQLEETLRLARRRNLHWLLIDMPPDLGTHTFAAVRAADLVLLPMRPALFDLAVTRQRVELCRTAGRRVAVVINAAPPRRENLESPLVRDARAALHNIGAGLWRGQITHRHCIPGALISGQGVAEVEPAGPAAAEYEQLWQAIVHNTQSWRISA